MGIIWTLIIGGVAGFLAGHFMKGEGSGVVKNIIIGIIGGFIGGFLFGLVGMEGDGLIMSLISATVGAVVLLWLIQKFSK